MKNGQLARRLQSRLLGNLQPSLAPMAALSIAVGCATNGVPEPIQILQRTGVEYAYPHWSADGQRILFQSNESWNWQLYVMSADGNDVVQLTGGNSNNNFPDWSPSNSEICFVSDRDGNEEIYVMRSDGTGQRRLTDNPAREIHPYWSPAGDKILFNSTRDAPGDLDVYSMNPDGTMQIRLTDSADNESCARLSPSGTRIVYLRNNDQGLDDVFLMDLQEGAHRNLTNTPTRNGWPCWTPSGEAIVLAAIEDERYKLFLYELESGRLTRLTNPPTTAFDGRANISSDGRRIVFNRQFNTNKSTIGIYVLTLDHSV
jgi:TolB protein